MNPHILTRNALKRPSEAQVWQQKLTSAISSPKELLAFAQIPPSDSSYSDLAHKQFPVKVPRDFAALINKGDRNDPILKQLLASPTELERTPGFSNDPLDEQDTDIPGLIHKYRSRILVMLSQACALHCRYCFRRHFPYSDNILTAQSIEQIKKYVMQNPSINEVILSGGDPLSVSDKHFANRVSPLLNLNQIKTLRIHTRFIVAIPERVTQSLIDFLSNAPTTNVLVIHVNHSQEISKPLEEAIDRLNYAGVRLYNQAVLLKGVNDNLHVQKDLWQKLFKLNVQPYYLHLLDKVTGASGFDVSDEKATNLHQQMQAELPGYLVPKLVREQANHPNKTLVI